MNDYIVGFAWDKAGDKLVLIKKRQGTWQGGLWNGVGGHLETYDGSPLNGIVREFSEETGVFIPPNEWKQFCTLTGVDYNISIFKAFTDQINNVTTTTDEDVCIFNKVDIPFEACISNLSWLIPMSREVSTKNKEGDTFYEIYCKEPAPAIKKKTTVPKLRYTGHRNMQVQEPVGFQFNTNMQVYLDDIAPRPFHTADFAALKGRILQTVGVNTVETNPTAETVLGIQTITT